MKNVFLVASVLTLVSCTTIPGESVRLKSGGRVALGAGLPTARIFLVSGDFVSQQYVREIIAQKKYWLEQGYKPEEIACYYTPAADNSDPALKEKVALEMTELRDCYLADPYILQKHIRELAQQNPKFVYLYVSGRGRIPLVEDRITYRDKKSEKIMKKALKIKDWSETYSIELWGYGRNQLELGLYDNLHKTVQFSFKYPKQADDFIFTPRGLRKALEALPETTQKVVVLQGCHTQGFLKNEATANTLRGMKAAKVLVSAQKEDPESGCNLGGEYTTFGEAYLNSLKKQSKKVVDLDWKKLHSDVKTFVKEREVILGTYEELVSDPLLYAN